MKLSREKFLGALFAGATFLALSGCSNRTGNLSYDMLKGDNDAYAYDNTGYELIIYDNSLDGDSERAMLVRYKHSHFEEWYSIRMWKARGDELSLTEDYRTKEEAFNELQNNYNVVFDEPALEFFITKYGIKEEYTTEEIQDLLDDYSNIKVKTNKKTSI